jgi:hypothetical protein
VRLGALTHLETEIGKFDAEIARRKKENEVLGNALLAAFHSPNWLWLTGIMGAHLIQASFTGICPVVMTLKKLGLPTKAGFA